jgi:hypothetical protein
MTSDEMSYEYYKDIGFNRKLNAVHRFCETIKRKLSKKFQKQNLMNFYRVITTSMILYGLECWTLTTDESRLRELISPECSLDSE